MSLSTMFAGLLMSLGVWVHLMWLKMFDAGAPMAIRVAAIAIGALLFQFAFHITRRRESQPPISTTKL